MEEEDCEKKRFGSCRNTTARANGGLVRSLFPHIESSEWECRYLVCVPSLEAYLHSGGKNDNVTGPNRVGFSF
jgi:hypothetical protein